jgi:DNA-directed RNA polymerase specialized sigma24 family protein
MEFAEFFEQTAPRLVRLCFLTTLDREAAADATQQALGRAWRDWGRVGAGSSDPAAWTTTVAINLCRNRWRRLASQARLAPRAYTVDSRSDALFLRPPAGGGCGSRRPAARLTARVSESASSS